MKKFKSILTWVMVFTLIMSIAVPTSVSATVQSQKEIDLEQAKKSADQNISIKLIDEQIKNAQARYDYAVRKAGVTNDDWPTDEIRAEVKRLKELEPAQKRNAVEVLKLQRAEKLTSIKLDITNAYFTYLFTQEQQKNQAATIERLSKKLQIIKSQFRSGKINESVLTETEIAFEEAEQQKDSIDRELSNITMKLNSLLGRSLDAQLKVVSQNIPFYDLKIDLNKLTSDRIAASSKILQAKNNEAEAKIEYDIANFSSTQTVPEGLEDAQDKLLQAGYEYKQLVIDEEHNVLNEYNNLLNLRDDISIEELKMKYSQKQMNIAEVQYKKGLIDIIAYNSSIENYEDSLIAYKKAQLDYFIAAETFK